MKTTQDRDYIRYMLKVMELDDFESSLTREDLNNAVHGKRKFSYPELESLLRTQGIRMAGQVPTIDYHGIVDLSPTDILHACQTGLRIKTLARVRSRRRS